ncbi:MULTISPECIES: type II toxin-antitoxin system RelE/ParE family toxin [unclassified Phaeobacter]|uniref:type II toxin-antitoxin system RelE/ParE family toxin n=1 Tax=unclassified Phaeobacter TaxID=2621772 RepID=UPI003A8A49EE
MTRILYSPLAEADLEDIWLFTAQRWSTEQAVAYTTDLINAVNQLARGDRTGRPVSIAEGMQKCLSGSHVIFFRRTEGSLVVVRVLHQSMDVERHL